jgi:HSP20 family protein
MAMTRFDPFRDLVALQDRMNRLFADSYQGRGRDEALINRGSWTPAVDIYEVDGALVIKAELPDVSREDIDVNIENNTLTLRGERKVNGEIKQEAFHRIERSYGAFIRQFSLPSTVDPSKVSADYKDGVLTVTLPVREEAKPRSVKINVAA